MTQNATKLSKIETERVKEVLGVNEDDATLLLKILSTMDDGCPSRQQEDLKNCGKCGKDVKSKDFHSFYGICWDCVDSSNGH